MGKLTIKIISGVFTLCGIYLLIKGDLTNGLLAIIVGELTDIPKID